MQHLLVDYGPYLGTFVLAFVSGFIPFVLVDALLVFVAMKTDANLPLVVLLAATATLLSKLPFYYGVRGLRDRVARVRGWIERMRRYRILAPLERHPVAILAASSVLGVPPFSIVATVAGALEVTPRTFAITVWVGRAVRFASVVAIARLLQP